MQPATQNTGRVASAVSADPNVDASANFPQALSTAHSASSLWLGFFSLLAALTLDLRAAKVPDYSEVEALFTKHCLDCHAVQEPEGKLVLESHESLMEGGEHGPSVVPGKGGESLLIKAVEGRWENEGKTKIMPPGKRKKLEPSEVALLKDWIDGGALAPKEIKLRELVTPRVPPKSAPRRAVQAIAASQAQGLFAVARYAEVELRAADSRAVVRTLGGHRGNVNALAFNTEGSRLATAAGQPGLVGEVRIWRTLDGTLERTFQGHRDALYAIAISPDGKLLATGSYDQDIKLWNVDDGKVVRTLHGHNGAVYDLAFRPDGRILASASGDRTVKLWEISTGKRTDTLSQSTKELYTLAWSGSGGRLFAAGVDNRIRIWRVSPLAAETTNPLLDSRFAHEGTIVNLVLSPDGKTLASSAEDRTVKLWNSADVTETLALASQPDVAPGLAFLSEGKQLVVGRLDGSLETYDTATGKVQAPPRPELTRLQPRGIQRGTTNELRLTGKNLMGATEIRLGNPKLSGTISKAHDPSELWLRVVAAADLARGPYELKVVGPSGESGPLSLHVDDIPQLAEIQDKPETQTTDLPVAFWGTLDKAGGRNELVVEGQAGQELVFDVSAKNIGSKLKPRLELFDAHGRLVAAETSFDGGDPLLVYQVPSTGKYHARVRDETMSTSSDHYFRLTAGALPFVVAVFPLSLPRDSQEGIQLIGYNLPAGARATVKTEIPGEIDVSVDPNIFRTRKALKVLIETGSVAREKEPNDLPSEATPLPIPGVANGQIGARPASSPDVDYFSFSARSGQTLVVETEAARRGSPVDTKLDVLHADGTPVLRTLLQAVRNTAINFRSVDAISTGMRLDHYEEMELNELLYINGDVMKLFRMPQGPDSEMLMYMSGGKRRALFDTTATAHALDEQGYIVVPHRIDDKLVSNGLPVFRLYYGNDDDGDRISGTDSKVVFTAPSDGKYLIKVAEATGRGGNRYGYRLVVREPKPDFKVTLDGANPTVAPGSGQSFSVRTDRLDGFDGEIRVEITGLPPGFSASTPLIIESGHDSATGTINASLDATKPSEAESRQSQVTAQALVDGRLVVTKAGDLGTVKLGDAKPKILVSLEPFDGQDTTNRPPTTTTSRELTIEPGQTVAAWLSVQRNAHDDVITFDVNNLPHGLIVDNIGLNGITFLKGENGRRIFITASKWVQPMERLAYAVENQVGRQTSLPLLLKVRRPATVG